MFQGNEKTPVDTFARVLEGIFSSGCRDSRCNTRGAGEGKKGREHTHTIYKKDYSWLSAHDAVLDS